MAKDRDNQRIDADPTNWSPNPLVEALGVQGPHDIQQAVATLGAGPGFAQLESPERCSFVGYLGDRFEHRGEWWRVLYLDWDMQTWLVIQEIGIIGKGALPSGTGTGTPRDRDVIWVKADAGVGRASRSLSLEGMFLSGDFMRAGDFDAGPGEGGTFAAATGVFCGARSPGCCIVTKKP